MPSESFLFPYTLYFFSFSVRTELFLGKIIGLVLNQSFFLCPTCNTPHQLFGTSNAAKALGIKLLAELPLTPGVSTGGDAGLPYAILNPCSNTDGMAGELWRKAMLAITGHVWEVLHTEVN